MWFYTNNKNRPEHRKPAAETREMAPEDTAVSRKPLNSEKYFSFDEDEPVSVSRANGKEYSTYRVPSGPEEFGATRWIGPGDETSIGGLSIPGGMLYVGSELPTPMGDNDPCLIDPKKPIAKHGDYKERQFGYWPSYSEIPPSARRAYLEWLAGGRQDPQADIGFVFLFFYGLERRAIIDASKSKESSEIEWLEISQELRRLLSIYGEKSQSFHRYGSELLNWVMSVTNEGRLYERPLPYLSKTYELPIYVKLALGQVALDGVPLPVDIAFAWAQLDPAIVLRTPAIRCSEKFEILFKIKYAEIFGAGYVLPKNKTKLKFVYRPASSSLQGYTQPTISYGEVPDISVLTGPVKKIQRLVDDVTKELDSFSRFIGRSPQDGDSLEALLLLPSCLWPVDRQQTLTQIQNRLVADMLVMTWGELQSMFGGQGALTRTGSLGLARMLGSANIGIEPDILSGARIPKPDEPVVLFPLAPGEVVNRDVAVYQTAVLTLELASAVATVDGAFSSKEEEYMQSQVKSWSHLTPNHQARLKAHLRQLTLAPVSLTKIKKKLEPLDEVAKEALAVLMATVAQSDGAVAASEIKMLERVYKALSVEPKKVFSHLHELAVDSQAASGLSSKSKETGFKLDRARVRALQQDTEKVSALLASIFVEEATVEASEPATEMDTEQRSATLLGLDEQHSSFARLLLSRPEWTRADLCDVAEDLDLLLDGALEHINEASFDLFDLPLTEGTDPVEVNLELLEKIEA
ncbi:TerB N-terminal domain-containing protein [Castellaniella sp.]|uniref:tellurite resistance TerB family protein n=1 Tax=Castellaniella sp. TaxID=1955812 RepID=UPI002AFE16C9|nr:TerB N-terminal domain-containing protein [Castellaniella sp.]